MTGALLQLLAYGAQDVFLTGNPQISFTVNRYHDSSSRIPYASFSGIFNRNTFAPSNRTSPKSVPYTNLAYTNRQITIRDRNMDCPIRLTKIHKNERYGKCSECKYNISRSCLLKALRDKNVCPMCRTKWTNCKMYKNKN